MAVTWPRCLICRTSCANFKGLGQHMRAGHPEPKGATGSTTGAASPKTRVREVKWSGGELRALWRLQDRYIYCSSPSRRMALAMGHHVSPRAVERQRVRILFMRSRRIGVPPGHISSGRNLMEQGGSPVKVHGLRKVLSQGEGHGLGGLGSFWRENGLAGEVYAS
uniref:C2H2-type domain-containing protein n=1 Tax=Esox lucius TaxID=8010 RepID=A0AAY5L7D9_ESOLU